MATQKKINNSTEYWAEILHQQWGVKAKLSELNGEYDLNFLAISSAHKPLILKIMRENCPKWLVEAQRSFLILFVSSAKTTAGDFL